MNNNAPILIITGPTGVGKTDLVDLLSKKTTIEIINGDAAQMVESVGIGTAKPDWKKSGYRQHLFDVISEPQVLNARRYRERVVDLVAQIQQRGAVPVVVGGTCFYMWSLFFSQQLENSNLRKIDDSLVQQLRGLGHSGIIEKWEWLQKLDPERASKIHSNDVYRVQRAFEILLEGVLPSSCIPLYDPIGRFAFVSLNRSKEILFERIKKRAEVMIRSGWREEAESLNESWREFVLKRKFIGYNYFLFGAPRFSEDELVDSISRDTFYYARKQSSFIRKIHDELNTYGDEKCILNEQVDLTSLDLDLYLDRLVNLMRSK